MPDVLLTRILLWLHSACSLSLRSDSKRAFSSSESHRNLPFKTNKSQISAKKKAKTASEQGQIQEIQFCGSKGSTFNSEDIFFFPRLIAYQPPSLENKIKIKRIVLTIISAIQFWELFLMLPLEKSDWKQITLVRNCFFFSGTIVRIHAVLLGSIFLYFPLVRISD